MQTRSYISPRLAGLLITIALAASACDTTSPDPTTVARVEVTPAAHSLFVGDEVIVSATVLDREGNVIADPPIAWTSSDTLVARVSTAGVATALRPGAATIIASVAGQTGAAQLSVARAPVASVGMEPSSLSIEENDTRPVTATPRDAAGRALSDRSVAWTTADPVIAEVDQNGVIHARQVGSTTVSATSEGKRGDVSITVVPATVASILITPSASVLEVGELRTLTAVARDGRGNTITGRAVTWSVQSDAGLARISDSGVLTAVRPGYISVVATIDGKTAAVGATIVAGEPYAYHLLYHRREVDGGTTINVLEIGSGAAPAQVNAGTVSSQPTASADGSRIAFAVSQFDAGTQRQIDDIYAVDRNGMNIQRLTDAAGVDDQPAWSPATPRIAYRHHEDGGRSDIWLMNADGTNPMNLTADFPAGTQLSSPAWSPDGARIAFSSRISDATGITASIWTMRGDGTDKRMLTLTTTGLDAAPTWAPDGQRIAFIRLYGEDADIAIISVAGGEPQRLQLLGRQFTPSWSPDGRFIAYAQPGANSQLQIYTVTPTGTQLRLRTVDIDWLGGFEPEWIARQ